MALVIMLYFGFLIIANAQQLDAGRLPDVSKPCPDFILRNIKYYPIKQAGLRDFKGKWLVLDFWNKGCSSCVQGFPHMNAIQKEFANRVQIMLVGRQDEQAQIQPMYDRFRERENLILPCAFDSSIANRWCIYTCPHYIILDEAGIVQGITNTINRDEIAAFLRGEHPHLDITYHSECSDFIDPRDHKFSYDYKKPFLIHGNGADDSDFLFRSVLSRFDHQTQEQSWPSHLDLHAVNSSYPAGVFQAIGIPLVYLYNFAYFPRDRWNSVDTEMYGNYFSQPIIETADSEIFHYDFEVPTKNVFCYSLIMPGEKATKQRMQQMMQRDLQNYFGFAVSIETRKFPCWKLVATDDARAKLRTAGGISELIELIPRAEYKLQNLPVKRLFRIIGRLGDPILDETGIDGNIDITIDCVDSEDMLRSLKENGLSLVPATKEMKVLVIRDPPNP